MTQWPMTNGVLAAFAPKAEVERALRARWFEYYA
jgi:hypothetical protein